MSSLDKNIQAAVYAELWRRGELGFLRHSGQKLMRDMFQRASGRVFYLNCSRRLGKSYELVLSALELCIYKPNARVLYLCAQATDAAQIAGDLMHKILTGTDEDGGVHPERACPEALKPEYKEQQKEYRFSNGSLISFKGANGGDAKFLRGTAKHIIIADEVANIDDLEFVINSILLPMLMSTNGKLLVASTPPRTPSHYSRSLYETCAQEGAAMTLTIRDAPQYADELKAEFLVRSGEKKEDALDVVRGLKAPKSTTVRREYFGEFVSDASAAVFPEFDEEARSEIVREWVRPAHFDAYVAMDPGSRDNTGILFFYLDYLAGKLVVEDEVLLHNPSTVQIAEAVVETERRLWGSKEPRRVSDVEPRLLTDFRIMYGLNFSSAYKMGSLAQVNFVRHLITQRMLVIHPNCKNFIRQMSNVIWNRSGNDFWNDREGEDKHFDLVAAAKYGFRFVDYTKSPFGDEYFKSPTPASPLKSRPPTPALSLRGDTPLDRLLSRKTNRKRQ